MVVEKEIEDKKIYIVDDHSEAFIPWGQLYATKSTKSNLITLDHHTDTLKAFRRHIFFRVEPSKYKDINYLQEVENILENLKPTSNESLKDTAEKIRNDEQIDAAIKAGILNYAFVISFSQSIDVPQIGMLPSNHIFEIATRCWTGCDQKIHTDECTIPQADEAIESRFLDRHLEVVNQMTKVVGIDDIFTEPYILDIDLDFFHTRKALTPDDDTTFRKLIRNAEIITIAKEPSFVEDLWLDDIDVPPNWHLQKVLEIIEKALA